MPDTLTRKQAREAAFRTRDELAGVAPFDWMASATAKALWIIRHVSSAPLSVETAAKELVRRGSSGTRRVERELAASGFRFTLAELAAGAHRR